MSVRSDPRHLYVHVPFCARRCSYCDFSIAVRAETPVDEYVGALQTELRGYDAASWTLDTVYLGGGTPSRLGGDGVARVLAAVRDVARVADDAEITIEVNPDDVAAEIVSRWRGAGVNRVSLGVQSFDAGVLEWMHRTHTAAQAEQAIGTIRAEGIDNISVDLIFAVPEALHRDWRRDVQHVVELAPSHVSLYGLTVEPHTPLGRWKARGDVHEAPEELYEADFLYAHDALTTAGFEHYEVSNYGRPGRWSRHNSAYWRSVPYVGVGPSAHGFDGDTRSWNVAPYAEWRDRLREGAGARDGSETLTRQNREVEQIYLGLRTTTGLEATDPELHTVRRWVSEGWATIANRRVVLTPHGWLRLDALVSSLTLAETR